VPVARRGVIGYLTLMQGLLADIYPPWTMSRRTRRAPATSIASGPNDPARRCRGRGETNAALQASAGS
jgi:hypothetical protein